MLTRRTLVGTGVAVLVSPVEVNAARRALVIADARRIPWRGRDGVAEKQLFRDEHGAETRVVKMSRGTTWELPTESDLFVVRGRVESDSQLLGRSFFARTAGNLSAVDDSTLLVLGGGGGGPVVRDTWDMPWVFSRGWEPVAPTRAELAAQPGQPLAPSAPRSLVKALSAAVRLCAVLPTTAGTEGFASRSDVEICVLQGSGLFGAHALAAGGYGRFRAGDALGPWASTRGCLALLRLVGSAELIAAAPPRRTEDLTVAPSPWASEVEG